MSNLAPLWTHTTLGDIGKYINGRGFRKDEWSKIGRPIIRIQNLTGSSDSFNMFDGDVEGRYVVRRGDLLVAWAATLGAYFWDGPEALLNQHIFRVESQIDVRFHKYLLDFKLREIAEGAHGSGMVHITRGRFESLPVAIPSIEEQRRIVDILEDHLSRLDVANAQVLKSRTRIAAWQESAYTREIWKSSAPTMPVAELLREPMRNGHSARVSRDGASGIRTLTLTAVTKGVFSDEYTKMTVADPLRVRDLWLTPGDILVQRSNTPDLVGTSARYGGDPNWAIFPDLLIRLRANEQAISSEYLALALSSRGGHEQMTRQAKGLAGSMPKIDQGAIGSVRIPVPSRDDQEAIVSRIQDMQQQASRLVGAMASSMQRTAGLRRALLEAAFSGRLTGRASDLDRAEEMAETGSS